MSIKYNLPSLSKGFTLLEVLVTLVILAIGLLGLAGVQATAMNFNHSSYQRTQATILAYDMVDRMRANQDSLNNYLSTFMVPGVATEIAACDNPAIANGCTSTQMAENDLFEWNQAISANLAPGNIAALANSSITLAGNTYNIVISWDENRDGVLNAADPSFQVSFLP